MSQLPNMPQVLSFEPDPLTPAPQVQGGGDPNQSVEAAMVDQKKQERKKALMEMGEGLQKAQKTWANRPEVFLEAGPVAPYEYK